MENHSAEWLRGRISGLRDVFTYIRPSQHNTAVPLSKMLEIATQRLSATVARETEEPDLAAQLQAARAEVTRLTAMVEARAKQIELKPISLEAVCPELLSVRDERMKRLGAAKVWEIVAERSKLVGDSAGEQYAKAEAARLEGE